MNIHEKYIRRCIQLAKNGLISAKPNPSVGCVIVCDDKIIGEGYTSKYGGAHGEVNAISSVKDKSLLSKSTLYVSLEPCSHFGKTPPCSDLIIKHKIPNVVIGVVDDNSLVAGKGIIKLKSAGCNVVVGVLENECRDVNKRFFHFHKLKRPYIVLKWAETKDGFIDRERGSDEPKQPNWISNGYSQQLVHKWRAEEQSILVGTNTVINDNPKLNVRKWEGSNPVRVVLDNSSRIPRDHFVFDGSEETIVFTSLKSSFEQISSKVTVEVIDYSKDIGNQICDVLYNKGIQSVLVEGGAKTIQTFIYHNLWDEARVFVGDVSFGKGVKKPEINGEVEILRNIEGDYLKIIKPLKS